LKQISDDDKDNVVKNSKATSIRTRIETKKGYNDQPKKIAFKSNIHKNKD